MTVDTSLGEYFYIALAGIQVKMTKINQPIVTGNQVLNNIGFKPKGNLFISFCQPASEILVNEAHSMIGGADSPTSRGVVWCGGA